VTPYPSPEEVDAACTAARVPGRGLSRMDMVAALEAAAEVRAHLDDDETGLRQARDWHAGFFAGRQAGNPRQMEVLASMLPAEMVADLTAHQKRSSFGEDYCLIDNEDWPCAHERRKRQS